MFGFVVDGMEVVRAIERVGTPTGKPRVDVTITECGMYYGVKQMPSGAIKDVNPRDTWDKHRNRALKAHEESKHGAGAAGPAAAAAGAARGRSLGGGRGDAGAGASGRHVAAQGGRGGRSRGGGAAIDSNDERKISGQQ